MRYILLVLIQILSINLTFSEDEIDLRRHPFVKEINFMKHSFETGNLSGTTFSAPRNRFFHILNDPKVIYETTPRMFFRRRIIITGMVDPEDIIYLEEVEGEHAANFGIIDETGILYICKIKDGQKSLAAKNCIQLDFSSQVETQYIVNAPFSNDLMFTTNRFANMNKGPEGVTYDAVEKTFYVVKEKSPLKLLAVDRQNYSGVVNAREIYNSTYDKSLEKYVTDFSGIYYNSKNDFLYILSHESHKIIIVDKRGRFKLQMKLNDDSQHEGITRGPKGHLIVTSEPFYWQKLTKPKK